MRVLLAVCGAAHLPQIARALQNRNALAGLWISFKNSSGIDPQRFRRAWIFHLAAKPFYHLPSATASERMHHALFPLWRYWIRRQKLVPFEAAQSILGYG